jgi:hydroxypyruvate isomerase
MQRRTFITTVAAGTLAATVSAQTAQNLLQQPATAPARKSRYQQSAIMVNFDPKMPFDEMCKTAARLGCKGFDLVEAKDWPTLKKYGLLPTIYWNPGNTFDDGIIRPELHAAQEKLLHGDIDHAAANSCPNVIRVGGQRRGMPLEQGMDNAVAFLNRVKAHAEDKGVTIILETMNPVDRPDQILNRLEITGEICKRVNSPRVKMLFDIYHAQRIGGDICDNIRKYYPLIAHFHTAGVPGRREIDETQELNYHFIAQTIAELGFTGFIGHEYKPSSGRDPVKDLEQAIAIMTV